MFFWKFSRPFHFTYTDILERVLWKLIHHHTSTNLRVLHLSAPHYWGKLSTTELHAQPCFTSHRSPWLQSSCCLLFPLPLSPQGGHLSPSQTGHLEVDGSHFQAVQSHPYMSTVEAQNRYDHLSVSLFTLILLDSSTLDFLPLICIIFIGHFSFLCLLIFLYVVLHFLLT